MEKATIVTYRDVFAEQEIRELAKAAGFSVAGVVTVKKIGHGTYGVGAGKAEELKDVIIKNGSKILIVDEELTSSQAVHLSSVTDAAVVDRDRLILDIFAKRAATTEAKLQVQLAELQYEFPRAKDAVRYSANGERAGFMGMGETLIDVKFRALKARMVVIKQKLEKAHSAKRLHRSERRKLGLPFVSLAGYTSSGKTTLFNKLASETKEESPDLFTTLSTTTRVVDLGDRKRKVLLSDTVGFVSRLPTYMVESFKSTLEELTFADVILLMVDASESYDSVTIKLDSCRRTLDELVVDPKKVILVVNKIDLLAHGASNATDFDSLFQGFAVAKVSATRGDGMHQLRNRIMEKAYDSSAQHARPPSIAPT